MIQKGEVVEVHQLRQVVNRHFIGHFVAKYKLEPAKVWAEASKAQNAVEGATLRIVKDRVVENNEGQVTNRGA